MWHQLTHTSWPAGTLLLQCNAPGGTAQWHTTTMEIPKTQIPFPSRVDSRLTPGVQARFFCNAMPWVDCTALRYHCTKMPDVDLCPEAYAEGRFPPGCSAKDFIRIDASKPPPVQHTPKNGSSTVHFSLTGTVIASSTSLRESSCKHCGSKRGVGSGLSNGVKR